MTDRHVVIVGGGAAGAAAARTVRQAGLDARVLIIDQAPEGPYNRTLVTKGVMTGLLDPAQAALPPVNNVEYLLDAALAVDPQRSIIRLESGRVLPFAAVLVATGSKPRHLGPDLPGLVPALASGRLTTLHSVNDARRVRALLAAHDPDRRARVAVLGAGLVGAEAASLLHQAEHDVTLVARSHLPLETVLGTAIAEHVAELHSTVLDASFGTTVTAMRSHANGVTLHLSDGRLVEADLVIVAHGTLASPPPATTTDRALHVDRRLRNHRGSHIYAAGGVALHRSDAGSPYRVDHWADAEAQGTHAARTLLHDLHAGADPGPYYPSSAYTVRIHDSTLTGIGITLPGSQQRSVSEEPPVTAFENSDGVTTGVVGLQSALAVRDWATQLHRPPRRPQHRPHQGPGQTAGSDVGAAERPA